MEFAGRIERMMRLSLGVDLDAEVSLTEHDKQVVKRHSAGGSF